MKLTDEEELSLLNCELVRARYPVKFLSVLPVPQFPMNVRMRIGKGAWVTMHVHDADAYVLAAIRKQRRNAKLDKAIKAKRKALKQAEARQEEARLRAHLKRRQLDADVQSLLVQGRRMLKSRPARP